jgi:hypothetical protein
MEGRSFVLPVYPMPPRWGCSRVIQQIAARKSPAPRARRHNAQPQLDAIHYGRSREPQHLKVAGAIIRLDNNLVLNRQNDLADVNDLIVDIRPCRFDLCQRDVHFPLCRRATALKFEFEAFNATLCGDTAERFRLGARLAGRPVLVTTSRRSRHRRAEIS